MPWAPRVNRHISKTRRRVANVFRPLNCLASLAVLNHRRAGFHPRIQCWFIILQGADTQHSTALLHESDSPPAKKTPFQMSQVALGLRLT
jgi:hypothetical protein